MWGWVGNVFLILGHFQIGWRQRIAFVTIGVGEACWVIRSLEIGIWDGVFLGIVFLGIQVINWRKWSNEDSKEARCGGCQVH